MPLDVLCIGHAAYDLTLVMDDFPPENSKREIGEMLESGGGPAANAAYLLSHWGVTCGFAGVVGDDPYGQRIREEFEKVGTDVSMLDVRPGHATPFSVILVNRQNGSRTIVNRKAATSPLKLDGGKLSGMSPGVLLFDGHELAASLAALEAFPEAVSILDAGSWREGTAGLAGRVDYLAASERFALQATGLRELDGDESRRECVARLREKYDTAVVVTLGERGLVADEGAGYFHLPAYETEVVDTTGAGDIFHGAFAYAVREGMPFREGLRFASLTAAISVRTLGARASIPTLPAVKKEVAHVD